MPSAISHARAACSSEQTRNTSWTVPVPEGHDLELVDVSDDGLADLVVNTQDGIEVRWQVAGDLIDRWFGHRGTVDLSQPLRARRHP